VEQRLQPSLPLPPFLPVPSTWCRRHSRLPRSCQQGSAHSSTGSHRLTRTISTRRSRRSTRGNVKATDERRRTEVHLKSALCPSFSNGTNSSNERVSCLLWTSGIFCCVETEIQFPEEVLNSITELKANSITRPELTALWECFCFKKHKLLVFLGFTFCGDHEYIALYHSMIDWVPRRCEKSAASFNTSLWTFNTRTDRGFVRVSTSLDPFDGPVWMETMANRNWLRSLDFITSWAMKQAKEWDCSLVQVSAEKTQREKRWSSREQSRSQRYKTKI